MHKLVDEVFGESIDWWINSLKMALEVFSSIRYYLKPEEISIDNWIFKLHYQISTAIWLGSSAIGVAKQYFGDPIECIFVS